MQFCLTGTKTNGKYVSLCEDHTQYDCFPTGLNYLAGLGVTHIQLMPVHDYCTVDEFHPEKNYNWGYDPMQYLSLEGSYSLNPDDPYSGSGICKNRFEKNQTPHGMSLSAGRIKTGCGME